MKTKEKKQWRESDNGACTQKSNSVGCQMGPMCHTQMQRGSGGSTSSHK
jgi:hypothetical protein